MDQIQFEHECHIDSVKYESGSIVDEDQLPSEWVAGALKAKFVSRVKQPPKVDPPKDEQTDAPKSDAPADAQAKPGVVPPEVEAAVKAAIEAPASKA